MKLLQFNMGEHRGCPARQLQLSATEGGEPAQLVALTGPSGSGKSTVIHAIALHKEHVAPYGSTTSAAEVLGVGRASLEISSTWLLDADEQKVTGSAESRLVATSTFSRDKSARHADPALVHILARYGHNTSWGKVDLWPVDRVASLRRPSPAHPLHDQKRNRLGRNADKYGTLDRLVLEASAAQRLELSTLLGKLRPGMGLVDDLTAARVRARTSRGARALAELSTSERLDFELAATFVLVGLHHSVVLMDTPELGKPCGEAAGMLRTLREHAPTTQFVVATTDRGILDLPNIMVIALEDK